MSFARALYTLVLAAALPGIAVYLAKKRRLNRECWGYVPPPPSGDSPVVWVHAVSVGEAVAADKIINLLHQRGFRIVITHTTAAGGEMLRARHGEYAGICLLPLDFPGVARRFINRTRPCMAVFMESEYWPNLQAAARNAGVVLFLANARLGKKSARSRARLSKLMREMVSGFAAIAAQTRADARRLQFFGASPTIAGNLKFEREPDKHLSEKGAQWRQQYREDKKIIFIAGSRPGEESLLLNAMDDDFYTRFYVVIAPRHPERGEEIGALLSRRGITFARRADNTAPESAKAAVYIADTLGEMDAFYAFCDVAVIGGSFLPFGGQNPIEAMSAGAAAVIGPHAENYHSLVAESVRRNALQQASDAADALHRAQKLADDENARQQQTQTAKDICARHRGALKIHADIIERLSPVPREPS